MGQARLKKMLAASRLQVVTPVAERAANALARLASSASAHFGADCYLHARLGEILLADEGVAVRRVAGYAAWRVGAGDGDVIAHMIQPGIKIHPSGLPEAAYHVWLETIEDDASASILIDLTSYQLEHKARMLDAADGGCTSVEWSPDVLIRSKYEVCKSFQMVAQAAHAGFCFYQEVPGMMNWLDRQYRGLDPQDVGIARLLMRNPHIQVRMAGDEQGQARFCRDSA